MKMVMKAMNKEMYTIKKNDFCFNQKQNNILRYDMKQKLTHEQICEICEAVPVNLSLPEYV